MGSNCSEHIIYNVLILVKDEKLSQQSVDYAAYHKKYFEAYCRFFRIQHVEHLVIQPLVPIPV